MVRMMKMKRLRFKTRVEIEKRDYVQFIIEADNTMNSIEHFKPGDEIWVVLFSNDGSGEEMSRYCKTGDKVKIDYIIGDILIVHLVDDNSESKFPLGISKVSKYPVASPEIVVEKTKKPRSRNISHSDEFLLKNTGKYKGDQILPTKKKESPKEVKDTSPIKKKLPADGIQLRLFE